MQYVYHGMTKNGESCKKHLISKYLHFYCNRPKSIFLDVLHFPMKNIKSRDLEATPVGGATSKPSSDVVCLLLLV